jgi:hypothetical protein
MNNQSEAKAALMKAWPSIVRECRQVLGSELHYQAMIYHCLRQYGKVPVDQIGMNVKMSIDRPKTKLIKDRDKKKEIDYQGCCELIPDIVLFKPSIHGDWRRRNYSKTLTTMLMAIEVKVSERRDARLRPAEIMKDIDKLEAHHAEIHHRQGSMVPVMIVIDTAPDEKERMLPANIPYVQMHAQNNNVGFFYVSDGEKIQPDW